MSLFAYRRPEHLRRTVNGLLSNPEARRTPLYLFCDAARKPEHQAEVDAVRRYAESIGGFAHLELIRRSENLGLARSIVAGVTEVLQQHESVIVVEDDLLTAPHFLSFMNAGLSCYAADEQVGSIHGYTYPVDTQLPETFFLRGADCWGWATWRRAWRHFNPNGSELLRELRCRGLTRAFDLGGAYPYTKMLEGQIAGRNDSWAIRWHASCFLKEMLTLYPARSLVSNIGNDGTGTHGGNEETFDVELCQRRIDVQRIECRQNEAALAAVARFFRRERRIDKRIVRRVRSALSAIKSVAR